MKKKKRFLLILLLFTCSKSFQFFHVHFDSDQNVDKHLDSGFKGHFVVEFEVIFQVFVLVVGHIKIYFFIVQLFVIDMPDYMWMIYRFHQLYLVFSILFVFSSQLYLFSDDPMETIAHDGYIGGCIGKDN